jgi:tetratricopeptide (TPR) repeat protein
MAASIRLFLGGDHIQALRYLREARYLYNKLLRECEFTPLGEAAVYRTMADTYWFEGDWGTAGRYYDRAMASYQERGDLYKILSAKCDIQLGELESARRKLREVDPAKLDPTEYVDYSFQYAALALKSATAEDGELAKSHLEKVAPRWPYFREARDMYRIALLSREGSKERAEAGRVISLLSGLLTYVNIRPGAFGVSVDVNKAIEDWIEKRRAKRA